MTRGRALYLAVALASVAGGLVAGRAVQPAAPEWQDAGALSTPRSHLNAVVLAGGEILVFGGLDPARPGVVVQRAELLDPRTGAVRVVDGQPSPRIDASTTTLADGTVVVAGGSERLGDDWTQVAVTELFDPATRRWRETLSMHDARADHGATALPDGRVLVAGGHRGTRMLASVEIFDPRTDRWTYAAPLPRTRQQFSIATLPDGRVLVAGGLEGNGLVSHSSLFYDPAKNAWTPGPELYTARVLHATVALPNGDVLLVAGQKTASASAERFDVKSGRFVYAGELGTARMLPQVAALPDGRVVVAGGLEPLAGEFLPTPSVEVWDPRTNAWAEGPEVSEASAFGGLVATQGDVWLIGGAGEGESALERVTRLRIP